VRKAKKPDEAVRRGYKEVPLLKYLTKINVKNEK